MAFIDTEKSVERGRPVILYAFSVGNVTWRYTSAEDKITRLGFEWTPAPLTDDGIKQTGETQNDAMTIMAPSWIGPCMLFMSAAPSRAIRVAIFATHEGSTDTAAVYVGEITQIDYPMPGTGRIRCETLASTMQREGLRLAWQRTCPYSLYDPLTCKVDKADWGVTFIVLTVNGLVVEVSMASGRAAQFFANGFIEWAHPVRGSEFLPVENHAGAADDTTATLLMFTDPGDLYPGATGTIYPGCNFTPSNCQAFDNYDNYGGIPDLPGKSPFDGSPVF
jgi:uncharacterized phage protein (TIGR02218 family)